MIDAFYAARALNVEKVLHSENTQGPDQTIRYPQPANDGRYTFSLFAFPRSRHPEILKAYFQSTGIDYAQKGYRSNMLSVAYSIARMINHSVLFRRRTRMTLDPVSTANPGWKSF